MKIELSAFGEKLGRDSGIQELMHDLGKALQAGGDIVMLGGGNPAAIPAACTLWRERMRELLDDDPEGFDAMLLNYDTPQGRPSFIDGLVEYFRTTQGWDISSKNVFVTNGSQTAFFYLFNLLAGPMPNGGHKKILLPLMPEYIGYADQGLQPDLFVSCRPKIELMGEREFKYHVDFDKLPLDDHIAAIAVSRPTNPTGNVLSDDELQHLSDLAKERGIPLIVDNAYGMPFPHILFTDATPIWEPHVVYSMSLSKLGLPGVRTGVVIADEQIIEGLTRVNAIAGLATGNVGQALVAPMVGNGQLAEFCRKEVTPFYEERALRAKACAEELLPQEIPWRLHVCEGAMFMWLWCKDLPISSSELYKRLQERGVIVVSGHYFFYGLDEDWEHSKECLRIHFAQDEGKLRRGLTVLSEELRLAYGEKL